MFVKHFAPNGNKVWKAIFSTKVSQGHKVIDIVVIWKSIISWIDRQDRNNMPPIIWSRGIKNIAYKRSSKH